MEPSMTWGYGGRRLAFFLGGEKGGKEGKIGGAGT